MTHLCLFLWGYDWALLSLGTWDPFTEMLAPEKMSPRVTEYKETIRDWNNCIHVQLEQIMNRVQEGQKPSCYFWGMGSKSRVVCMTHAHSATKGGLTLESSPTLSPFKGPTQAPFRRWAREHVTCFCSLMQQNDLSPFPRQNIHLHSNSSLCPNH